jgi:hypothetical protein
MRDAKKQRAAFDFALSFKTFRFECDSVFYGSFSVVIFG